MEDPPERVFDRPYAEFMYKHGRGVARDLDTAASWYRKGADAGFKKSVENLQRLAQQ
jgi:TPR repeat protein